MKTKRLNIPPTVRFTNWPDPAFKDGSGCPAIVMVGEYQFACDMLGRPTLNLIAPYCGSQYGSRVAAVRARRDYRRALELVLTPEWRELNRMMYATEASS